jgi:hypothetical protein
MVLKFDRGIGEWDWWKGCGWRFWSMVYFFYNSTKIDDFQNVSSPPNICFFFTKQSVRIV